MCFMLLSFNLKNIIILLLEVKLVAHCDVGQCTEKTNFFRLNGALNFGYFKTVSQFFLLAKVFFALKPQKINKKR